MKKLSEPSGTIKLIVLILCIINVVVLIFLLHQEAKASSNLPSISYNVSEEETKEAEAEADSKTAVPVLILDESAMPELSQDDLYELKDVLIREKVLSAEDGMGNDISNKITWSLKPLEDEPGKFDAAFTVENENRRNAGASLTVSTELTAPFLKLTDEAVVVPIGSDFSISPYIDIAIDIDGTDITEGVSTDTYVSTASSGTYNLELYVYSRISDSMTRRNLKVTVQ